MKLNHKHIEKSIKFAQKSDYFDRLNKIYNTIPTGRCLGCTNCCMESVSTHFVEFLNIIHYLTNRSKLYKEILPNVVKYYFLEMVDKTHCPFLDESGKCVIYPVRPLVCRVFGHLTKEEYEEGYKRVLSENIGNMKMFKNQYGIFIPEEVAYYKIDYCTDFEVCKRMTKQQRQTMIDSIFTMESSFFMRGLITEDFLDLGLVSWFAYIIWDKEEAGKLKIQVMQEYVKGENKTLSQILEKVCKDLNQF
ncbi:YkgJ family cysteine cluster protein [Inediibacterium massiliense]|uniref:YkgJ family cysteine cluster protein n=1 Tax=Inediibacterium massiliense TaxID=1658111 RepID=UPI0006B52562|nr:YkgJ family cysteine cluster protein [Inediibacterium massiliense]